MEQMSEEISVLQKPVVPALIADQSVATPDKNGKQNLAQGGLMVLAGETVRDLKEVGIFVEGIGVMKTASGGAIINQRFMLVAQQKLAEKLMAKKVSQRSVIQLARTMGFVGSKITEAQSFLAKLEGFKDGKGEDDKPRTPSFPPGGNIVPAVQPQVNLQINVSDQKQVEVVEKKAE